MTEQPDTAALRVMANAWHVDETQIRYALEEAADALDRARKQRDSAFPSTAAYHAMKDRAEAAELTVTTLRRRLAAAESDMASMAARISATREILRDAYDRGDFEAIDRALTEGTGQ